MLLWHQSKSNSQWMLEWLIVSPFQFAIFGSAKTRAYKMVSQSGGAAELSDIHDIQCCAK